MRPPPYEGWSIDMWETRKSKTARFIAILFLAAISILPFAFMLRVGLAAPGAIQGGSPNWLAPLYIYNIVDVLYNQVFIASLVLSFIVATISSLIAIMAAAPAAFVSGRMRFRGQNDFEFWILSTRMLPPVVVVIPYFLLFSRIDGTDTVWALVIMHVVVKLAICRNRCSRRRHSTEQVVSELF